MKGKGEAGARCAAGARSERREGAGVDEDSGGRVMGRGSGDQEVVYGGGCNNACNKSIMLVRGEKVKKDYDGNIKGTILSGTTHRSLCTDTCCGGGSAWELKPRRRTWAGCLWAHDLPLGGKQH